MCFVAHEGRGGARRAALDVVSGDEGVFFLFMGSVVVVRIHHWQSGAPELSDKGVDVPTKGLSDKRATRARTVRTPLSEEGRRPEERRRRGRGSQPAQSKNCPWERHAPTARR